MGEKKKRMREAEEIGGFETKNGEGNAIGGDFNGHKWHLGT